MTSLKVLYFRIISFLFRARFPQPELSLQPFMLSAFGVPLPPLLEVICVNRSKDVDKIAAKEHDMLRDLCEYIFEKYPPKHISGFESRKPDFSLMAPPLSGNRPLQKMVTLYHPDRVDKDKHGMEYFVLCEEITKILNRRYNNIKLRD